MSPEPAIASQQGKWKARQLEATSPPLRPQGYYSVYSSQQGPELDDFEGLGEDFDPNEYLKEWEQGQQVYNDDWDQDNQPGYGGIWDQDEREGDEHDLARDSPPKHGRRADNNVCIYLLLHTSARRTDSRDLEPLSRQEDCQGGRQP